MASAFWLAASSTHFPILLTRKMLDWLWSPEFARASYVPRAEQFLFFLDFFRSLAISLQPSHSPCLEGLAWLCSGWSQQTASVYCQRSTLALGQMTSSSLPFPSLPTSSRRFPHHFSSIFLPGFPQSPIPA